MGPTASKKMICILIYINIHCIYPVVSQTYILSIILFPFVMSLSIWSLLSSYASDSDENLIFPPQQW